MIRFRLFGFSASAILSLGMMGTHSLADEPMREWTDSTGKHRSKASFVSADDSQVTMVREDGKRVTLPLDRLSAKDKVYVRKLLAAQAKAAKMSDASDQQQVALIGDAEPSWLQWRGKNRDGICDETGLLKSWPEGGPPVAWKSSGLGGGYSSVVIADNKIVTMGQLDGQTKIIAVSLEDGSKLWDVALGGGDAPNCTPTIDGDYVYGVSHAGDLLCAELATGKEVWRKNFPKDFGGKMMSGWGYSESPLVDGSRLIVTPGAPDAALAALDKRTGEVIWKSALPPNPGSAGQDGAAYSSVVAASCGGVNQYIQLVGRGVIGVNAETGEFLWGYNRVANGTANIPTPIVSGDLVFCSSGYDDGGSALLRIAKKRNMVSMEEVWYKNNKELQNHHGGMILIGDHVFMGHGHNNGFPVCFDLKTGQDAWRPGRGVGGGSAAVLYADGHLYFRYEDGIMALVEANPKSYELKGKFKIGIDNGKSWAHPVIYKGRLYLRDQDEMICYDIHE
jgi:outer membrane protein assembly factor BamB